MESKQRVGWSPWWTELLDVGVVPWNVGLDLTHRYRVPGEQPLLNTGPVILGFTPINRPRSSDIHAPTDGQLPSPDQSSSRGTALQQTAQHSTGSSKPRSSTKTTRKRTTDPETGDCNLKLSKRPRIQSNAISQLGSQTKKPHASQNSIETLQSLQPTTLCTELGENPALWKLPVGNDGRGEEGTAQMLSQRSNLQNRDQEDIDEAYDSLDEGICDEDFLTLANSFDEDICDDDFLDLIHGIDENVNGEDFHKRPDVLDEDIDDGDLLKLASALDDSETALDEFVPVHSKLNWGPPKPYQQPEALGSFGLVETPDKGTVTKDDISSFYDLSPFSSQVCTAITFSPVKPTSDLISTSPALSEAPRHLKPFISPKVPPPVGERSPIAGVSSYPRVVTHFRLGQALNDVAARNKEFRASDAIVELYARVLKSRREGSRQTFQLADLFHYNRAPFLHAEWVGWQGLPYFEVDGAAFLEEAQNKKICRAIGRIEKDVINGWRMCVLSVWEASWDDIDFVKGIVCI